MAQAPLISHLAWDSEFFGTAIAKTLSVHLQPREVDLAMRECDEAGVKCLYCELDPEEIDTIAHVQQVGFRFVECRLVLAHDLGVAPISQETMTNLVIDDCPQPQDHSDLATITDSIAPMSRFAADPYFGLAASRRMYARWLQNCLDDVTVTVLVARLGGRVAGYVALKPRGHAMQLTLLGVGPEHRGQGIGARLAAAAVQAAGAAGATRLELITQGRNVKAVRTYERAGFMLAANSYYFHKWWE